MTDTFFKKKCQSCRSAALVVSERGGPRSVITSTREVRRMKLEVGDIKMDSDAGISFTQQQRTPVTHTPSLDPPHSEAGEDRSTATRRGLLYALVISGALMSALTTLVALGALSPLLLLGWGLIAALALVTLMTGRVRAAQRERVSSENGGEVERERARRLLRLLDAMAPMDVRALTEETGWSEEAVLSGLVFLLERELVEEDVDLETGHFCYARSHHVRFDFEEREALAPAAERLSALRSSKP